MPQYRATKDIAPLIKEGDIVTTKEDLIPEYEGILVPVSGGDDAGKSTVINPNRDELKARATELGITFASNIPTDKLMSLVAEAEAEAEKQAGEGEGGGDEGGDGEGSETGAENSGETE